MRQPLEFDIVRATQHKLVFKGVEVEEFIPEIRAVSEQISIGTIPTDKGDIGIHQVDFGPLTEESIEVLRTLREKKVGRRTIAVSSLYSALAERVTPGFKGDPMQDSIAVGYPALINREDTVIKEAGRIGILPARPQAPHDLRYYHEIEKERFRLVRQQVPMSFISRSPDQLPLPTHGTVEPNYNAQTIGRASLYGVEVAREWPASITEIPPINPESLIALHSKALLAELLLGKHAPETAARFVMPLAPERDKDGQVIPGIRNVGFLGRRTLELWSTEIY